ncbi:MAG TPA: glutamate dehydrogenase, partial [Thermodesulfovibrionales bacterium]|nr:glutamate dehydrogenase [Thermodesulfovibrionales bacterium]
VTGKPLELAGSRARSYSTSLGGIYILEEAMKKRAMEPSHARVVVQGFGHVGENAARILFEKGYRVVAVSDSRGGIINEKGLDIHEVTRHKEAAGSVGNFKDSANISNAELLTSPCEILIPAALSDQIHRHNAPSIQAKIILELANAPSTTEADDICEEKGIMVVPDILANAGGVVVSYFEWSQNLNSDYWDEERVLQKLKNTMSTAFSDVYGLCQEEGYRMRRAAYKLAIKRVLHAERLRGNV